jgi:hypothetical protein
MTATTSWYELVDIETANMLGTYATEEEALAIVADTIAAEGPEYVGEWAVGYVDASGHRKVIARGSDLVARAVAPRT